MTPLVPILSKIPNSEQCRAAGAALHQTAPTVEENGGGASRCDGEKIAEKIKNRYHTFMYSTRIDQIKKKFGDIQREVFDPAESGTHHKVFLSKHYVIRFRKDKPNLLMREGEFLKSRNHPLIPKVLWMGGINGSSAMIENRLPGESLDKAWKKMNEDKKESAISGMIEFITYMRSQSHRRVYSVNTGKEYNSFREYIVQDSKTKFSAVGKNEHARPLLEKIKNVLSDPNKLNALNDGQNALVHGDLIMHNILVRGGRITGVLDWELALWGDPDYDLARMLYYEECAKVYEGEGVDTAQERDYMTCLKNAVVHSFMKNQNVFNKKYDILRAFFYVRALYWAATSDNPRKNIDELTQNWEKK